jgi:macrolide transport system ATP-binding/permease protein
VHLDDGVRVAYLPQEQPDSGLTFADVVNAGLGKVGELRTQLARLETTIQNGGSNGRLLTDYLSTQTQFEELDGWEVERRLDQTAEALAVSHLDPGKPLTELSGGEASRALIVALLLSSPDVLLLDEPTNHLDISGLEWLERYLTSFSGTVLVVSHDREFLDRSVTRVFELQPDGIEKFDGGYSAFKREKEHRRERLLLQVEAQDKRRRRLQSDIRATRQHARKTEETNRSGPGADKQRRYAKKVARKALARERRLEREMESDGWIELPREPSEFKLLLPSERQKGRLLVRLSSVSVQWGDAEPVLRDLDLSIYAGERIAIIGNNGVGKSSLLSMLAGELNPTTGRREYHTNFAYLPQTPVSLPLSETILGFFKDMVPGPEHRARTFLGHFRFGAPDINRTIGSLSPGERSRLLLAVGAASQPDLLLLDEPTNHLDFESLDVIETALASYQGGLVVASHDRTLIRNLNCTTVLKVENGELRATKSGV